MNLNTITEVRRVTGDENLDWREGDSWLAGGTWLFSEPQPHLRRLLDLQGFDREPLVVSEQGLQISPTCTIAELNALEAPPEWTAAPLIRQCCHSFLASFKVWNTATVGGNICMSLPAGPMISLSVALEGIYTLRLRDGSERRVAAEEFTTGDNQNILQPGDLLRSIELPIEALRKQTSFRRMSLTHLGRSSALLIGTLSPQDGTFMLTVSASTKRPIRLSFDQMPDARSLHERLRETIPDSIYHDDVHGAPDYRKHLTFHFGEEIRRELSGNPSA
ncbi:MAG: Xanthine dehydrogenase, FAD binding subunit [uncultured Rubrobacteraceae bacterium]|uniref:Xanthine dehydrogenase, FAD binding subunit n=1 Tax=uncultured Rubrobacteraceae bacterium TaxID=349277 RepID=A0A6J4RAK3_9ACTN|nr:MAG: Xanthine dehydrogenase, FAD binding subunit [uncultured Rubrobacteraceae bacterium]